MLCIGNKKVWTLPPVAYQTVHRTTIHTFHKTNQKIKNQGASLLSWLLQYIGIHLHRT